MTNHVMFHPTVILGWLTLIGVTYWLTDSLLFCLLAVLLVVALYVSFRTIQERSISVEFRNFLDTFVRLDRSPEHAAVFDKMWFGKEEHVVGVLYRKRGICLFVSSKLNGVLLWEDVVSFKIDSKMRLVRIRVGDFDKGYSGLREIRIPWRDGFVDSIPSHWL